MAEFTRWNRGRVSEEIVDLTKGLTEDQLRAAAPSVFQTHAHESRSERFQPIPTIEVVRALNKEGFVVVGARQSLTRDPGKADFTKHLLRLRKLDQVEKLVRNGTAFEVLLKNANDGTSAYDLLAGFWRFICGNGLMVGDKLADVKVRHSGDVATKVVEGTYSVLDRSQLLLEAPEKFAEVHLNGDEQQAFANAAHILRFGEPEGPVQVIEPTQLLKVRRPGDSANDLWTVFNRVQENAIKGGLQGVRVNEDTGQTRRVTTRQIKGIDQDVKLNRALWVLAESMANLKAPQQAAA